MKRHEMRQLALQALYQVDVGKADVEHAVGHVLSEASVVAIADHEQGYIFRLVNGVQVHLMELDELLETNVQGWKVDRIARVDLNVLRLALFELLYEADVDLAIVIDEAVELAKHFSTAESGKFVNGVLARFLSLAQERRKSIGV